MNLDALLPWMASVALLSLRLSVAVALSPAVSAYGVPGMVRTALTLALATLTLSGRSPMQSLAAWPADPAQLLVPAAAEVFIGALLGLGIHVVLAACALAGRLMDVQAGFAIGSVFDPVTRANSNVLGSLTSLLGVTLFFASGAHLEMARMISQSIDILPLGELPVLNDPMQPLLAAGAMFTLGLALSAPVAMALLLTDLAVGVASRNLAQVNVLILASPLKVLVAYMVLALSVLGWTPLLRQGLHRMADALGGR